MVSTDERVPAGAGVVVTEPSELGSQSGQIIDKTLVAVHPGWGGGARGDRDGLPALGGDRLAMDRRRVAARRCDQLAPSGGALRELIRGRLTNDLGRDALVDSLPTARDDQRVRMVRAQVIQRWVGIPQVEQPHLTA
jgi:hypothetical protein